MSLSHKAFSGFFWTFLSRTGTRLSIFVVSIILSRLLTPGDFGLVAMLGVFFAISNSIVDSGFTSALIREKEITEEDKSTVFFINLITSFLLYGVLWFGASLISEFYNQPQLLWLTRVMGLDIIFRALTIVQRAEMLHMLKYKILTIIDLSTVFITGLLAIYLAYDGYGIWSLVIKYISTSFLAVLMFSIINPWVPKYFINIESFNKYFNFGFKLLITGLINSIYTQGYNLVIGKFFSPIILGFYNRAFLFTNQIISNISVSIYAATYPILSKTKDDFQLMKRTYGKMISVSTFINVPLSIGIAIASEPIVLFLLGKKWIDTIPFLQILCIGAAISHLSGINQNLLKVIGRSDLILKISIFVKIFTLIAIFVGILSGIRELIIGSVIIQYIEVAVNLLVIRRTLNYSLKEQIQDILPTLINIVPFTIFLLFVSVLNIQNDGIELLIMIIFGGIIYIVTSYFNKSTALKNVLEILLVYKTKLKFNKN